MITKEAKNKWAKGVQRQAINMANEASSCAAIDGARMTESDREKLQSLGRQIAELLSKY